MSANFLKLNSAKTEFIAFDRSTCSFPHLSNLHLVISDQTVPLSSEVMNLGVCLDSSFKLSSHVKHIVRTCNFHFRNLWRIRRFIDVKTCHHAVRALIISRLDYCNSLFTVLSFRDKKKLESIQNRAARLVFAVGRKSHTTPLLNELHWLPLPYRINFKICLSVYKIINCLAPQYLTEMLALYKPVRNLRSLNDKTKLTVPRFNLSFPGYCFSVFAPKIWNDIPQSIREITTITSFKKQLKTHFFLKL